jgi:hypothetical protein
MKPLARIIGKEFNFYPFHMIDDDGILPDPPFRRNIRVHNPEKMAVQMHRMRHHTVVPITKPHTLSLFHG